MPVVYKILIVYGVAVNLAAIAVTAADKRRAKRRRWRVPEATLLLLALLGGSVGMYITMRCIHHKTLKKAFMWGIPLIIVLQAALALALLWPR